MTQEAITALVSAGENQDVDYGRPGAVHVQWHDDRVEASNPGGFPEGVRLDNLLVTAPRPRDPLLADAFKRAGIVERTARGIDTIFSEQLRNGRPAPSYARSNETGVVLVLPRGEANLRFVQMIVEESRDRLLGLDDLLILNQLWQQRRFGTAEASALIQKPEPEARAVLQRLAESGLIEARGDGKGRTWHLSAPTYRRLGEKAAYVRQHGFEPAQQEQIILQYVQKHGQIARKEAADLCRIAPTQARDLLKRMVTQGELAMEGQWRVAIYVLPSKVMDKSKRDLDTSKRDPKGSGR